MEEDPRFAHSVPDGVCERDVVECNVGDVQGVQDVPVAVRDVEGGFAVVGVAAAFEEGDVDGDSAAVVPEAIVRQVADGRRGPVE